MGFGWLQARSHGNALKGKEVVLCCAVALGVNTQAIELLN
jgi:hypothetical protein